MAEARLSAVPQVTLNIKIVNIFVIHILLRRFQQLNTDSFIALNQINLPVSSGFIKLFLFFKRRNNAPRSHKWRLNCRAFHPAEPEAAAHFGNLSFFTKTLFKGILAQIFPQYKSCMYVYV